MFVIYYKAWIVRVEESNTKLRSSGIKTLIELDGKTWNINAIIPARIDVLIKEKTFQLTIRLRKGETQ